MREFYLQAEWAWSENLLNSEAAELAFTALIFEALARKHSSRLGNKALALKEIHSDLKILLKKLRYGGRSPADLHPARRLYLQRIFQS